MIGGAAPRVGRATALTLLAAAVVAAGAPFSQRPVALADADPPRWAHAVEDAHSELLKAAKIDAGGGPENAA